MGILLCMIGMLAVAGLPQTVWVEGSGDVSASFRTTFDWNGSDNPELAVSASAVYRALFPATGGLSSRPRLKVVPVPRPKMLERGVPRAFGASPLWTP